MSVIETTQPILFSFLTASISYLPSLIGGIIIFTIGILLAGIVKKLVNTLFSFFKLGQLLSQIGISKNVDIKIWNNILSEIVGWGVIILFLIPASEVWGLPKVTDVLRQLLFYIPNVLVAVIIAFIGLMFANLAADLVLHGVKTVNKKSAKSLSALARYAIVFFTVLVVMDQLRVAQDLIRILFTGIVVMLALAGGLAFGLGGKDIAKELLEKAKKSLHE